MRKMFDSINSFNCIRQVPFIGFIRFIYIRVSNFDFLGRFKKVVLN